tara:strand:- start:3630 stop:3857 length:228 start_codon:yes stop_codon:yes gene_type:complete
MTEAYRIVELLKELKSIIIGNKQEDNWLDIKQASKYCAVSTATLRRNVKANRLQASNKLGKMLFKKSELESWLNG